MKNLYLMLMFCLVQTIAYAQVTPHAKIIIESFYQGENGNCASIAAIKLAIGKWGTVGVWQKIDSTDTEYHITLRDGILVTLTKAELNLVKGLDAFADGKDASILKASQFLYAIMAKNRFATENAAGHQNICTKKRFKRTVCRSYATIAEVISEAGEKEKRVPTPLVMDAIKNLKLLGLKNNYDSLTLDHNRTTAAFIVSNIKHAAYGSMGFYDQMGNVIPITDFISNHGSRTEILAGRRNLNPYIYYLKD